jgi:uncharacterized protein
MPDNRSSTLAKCPICKKLSVTEFTPFCSAGCKDRDLLQWLGEGYRLPGPAALLDDEDAPSEYRDSEDGF